MSALPAIEHFPAVRQSEVTALSDYQPGGILANWTALVDQFITFKRKGSVLDARIGVIPRKPVTKSTEALYRRVLGARPTVKMNGRSRRQSGLFESYLRQYQIERPDIHAVNAFLTSHRLSDYTHNLYATVIKAFFRYLDERRIYSFPHRLIHVKSLDRKPGKAVFPEDWYRRLIGVIDVSSWQGMRDKLIFVLMMELGQRTDTVASLGWNDIAERPDGRYTARFKMKWKEGKTSVVIPAWIGAGIFAYREAVKQAFPGITFDETKHLFISESPGNPYGKRPLSTSYIRELLYFYLEQAGITRQERLKKRVSAHSFKHAFVTRQVEAGTSLEIIGAVTGNSPQSLKGYDQANKAELAVNLLERQERQI